MLDEWIMMNGMMDGWRDGTVDEWIIVSGRMDRQTMAGRKEGSVSG